MMMMKMTLHQTANACQLQMKCFCYQVHQSSCYDQSSNQYSSHEGDADDTDDDDDDDGDDFDDGTSYDEAMTHSSDLIKALLNVATTNTMNLVKFDFHDVAIVVDAVAN